MQQGWTMSESVCEKPLKQTPWWGSCNVQVYSQKLVFWHHCCVNVLDPCDMSDKYEYVLDIWTAVQKDHCTSKCLPKKIRIRVKETQVAVLLARWIMCLGHQFMKIVGDHGNQLLQPLTEHKTWDFLKVMTLELKSSF